MGDAGNFHQRIGFHQPALNTETRRFITGEKLGVNLVNRGVILPVGDKDTVEGHIRHTAPRRFDNAFDNLQHVTGLRLWVAGVDHIVLLIERQSAGDIYHSVGERPWNKGGNRRSSAGGIITCLGIAFLLGKSERGVGFYGAAEAADVADPAEKGFNVE